MIFIMQKLVAIQKTGRKVTISGETFLPLDSSASVP